MSPGSKRWSKPLFRTFRKSDSSCSSRKYLRQHLSLRWAFCPDQTGSQPGVDRLSAVLGNAPTLRPGERFANRLFHTQVLFESVAGAGRRDAVVTVDDAVMAEHGPNYEAVGDHVKQD